MSDKFNPALDLVLDVLKNRREAGAVLKASVVSLSELVHAGKPSVGVNSEQATVRKAGVPVEEAGAVRTGGYEKRFEPVSLKVQVSDENSLPVSSDKVADLAALRIETASCLLCPNLVQSRFSVVFGEGNPDAELMLVGEAPGADEDMRGQPFVGAAGELLEKMLIAMGFSRADVFIANVLKCRPDMPAGSTGNRKPSGEEMERCLPYLRKQIGIVRPKAIVALGATAMQGLFGKTEAMARLRSQWYQFQGIPVMATYHPSYLLRNQALSERRKVWEDLLQVLEKLNRPISAKQRGYFAKSAG